MSAPYFSQILLFLIFLNAIAAYKVLVFNPAFGASHSNYLGKISDILIDAGHDVTMLIPTFVDEKKDLVGSKKVKNVIRLEQDQRIYDLHIKTNVTQFMKKQIWKTSSDVTIFLSMIGEFSKCAGYQCQHLFQQEDLIKNLKTENYDLAISESLFICSLAFFDHLGIKNVVLAESILYMDAIKYATGEPSAASFYPGVFSSVTDEMNLLGRTKNLMGLLFSYFFTYHRWSTELEYVQPYYTNNKKWTELIDNVAYNMINSNQYLDYASPILPKTVFVGGMQVQTNKKNGKVVLSKEWNAVLSERKLNVLVSFGSNAYSSDMPDDIKGAFLKLFEAMPQVTFIWKYEIANATIASHLPNVILTTWMPQNDLLADERLSLFVTHGGLGSTVELAYQGKPAVVIPLMADQPRNAHMLTRHGGAIQVDKENLNNPQVLQNAIETVLKNDSYRENAKRLSEILKSQPQDPKETVLKYCEFAVKFGPIDNLNSAGRHLNVFQYYCVDIFATFVVLLYVFYKISKFVSLFVYRFVISRLFKNKSKTD